MKQKPGCMHAESDPVLCLDRDCCEVICSDHIYDHVQKQGHMTYCKIKNAEYVVLVKK